MSLVIVVVEGVRIAATEFYCSDCQSWWSTVQTHAYRVRAFNRENRRPRRVRTVSL